MAIKQDPKSRFTSQYGTEENGWRVCCDHCSKASYKAGIDAGAAADFARKEGFTTKPNGSQPSKWLCPACK